MVLGQADAHAVDGWEGATRTNGREEAPKLRCELKWSRTPPPILTQDLGVFESSACGRESFVGTYLASAEILLSSQLPYGSGDGRVAIRIEAIATWVEPLCCCGRNGTHGPVPYTQTVEGNRGDKRRIQWALVAVDRRDVA
ncbi:uncharacterized protein N7459_002730 [Penicillium hispanicum]|uniref:uncharacterized protein n=1 Tax=Penicillium hispanicum TaxID=1080232 RepID=UPI002540F8E8|nr:uncharacterized protein N7459_002730 [Penicillium hispanicum]KAJ5586965.1 hypothetical protein N7459_002730 [Penicillium hispanicum]